MRGTDTPLEVCGRSKSSPTNNTGEMCRTINRQTVVWGQTRVDVTKCMCLSCMWFWLLEILTDSSYHPLYTLVLFWKFPKSVPYFCSIWFIWCLVVVWTAHNTTPKPSIQIQTTNLILVYCWSECSVVLDPFSVTVLIFNSWSIVSTKPFTHPSSHQPNGGNYHWFWQFNYQSHHDHDQWPCSKMVLFFCRK